MIKNSIWNWTLFESICCFIFFFWLFRQSLVSAAVGVHCTDMKVERFSGWIRSERGRFCPKRHRRPTFSLSEKSVLTFMDARGNGRLSGVVLLFLPAFHQLVHILRYFIIGYFGISLCGSDICMSHHLWYTFHRDSGRNHQGTEGVTTLVIWQIMLELKRETQFMYFKPNHIPYW